MVSPMPHPARNSMRCLSVTPEAFSFAFVTSHARSRWGAREIIRVEPLSSWLERWKAPTSVAARHSDTLYVSGCRRSIRRAAGDDGCVVAAIPVSLMRYAIETTRIRRAFSRGDRFAAQFRKPAEPA